MGAFLDKPKTEKHNETGHGNKLRYGLSSMQGWRVEMEDAHCAKIGLPGLEGWSFFAVFDGHAGNRVSLRCSNDLINEITENKNFHTATSSESSQPNGTEMSAQDIKDAIKAGFLGLDSKMRESPEVEHGQDKSGSTAVCVMISPTQFYFANCGDSRGILCQKGDVAFHTLDHKPNIPEEKKRITEAGGSVMIQRVNGSLAVSRALGDYEYKNVEGKGPCDQLVSPEPEIFEIARTDEDEFLILACDGIWDVMSNEDLCKFVRSRMQLTEDLQLICNQVVDLCLHKGSRDNMSIVIVAFEGAPKVSQEALQKEDELNKLLEDKINVIIEQSSTQNFEVLLQEVNRTLAAKENEIEKFLPPGGGLHAKKSTIEEIVKKLNPQSTQTSSD